jgi:hypothetical protein
MNMKPKDRVIYATDQIADVLRMLCRINYDNDAHMRRLSSNAAIRLRIAAAMFEANTSANEKHDCSQGLHSWVNEKGKLAHFTKCVHCGELYGGKEPK